MNRGRQLRRADARVQVLREREVRVHRCAVRALRCSAAVELPVEQRERDAVRHPNDRAGFEQVAGRVRLRAAVDEVVDQHHRRPQRPDHEHGHEPDREHAQLSRAARDRARVGCDHCDEQQGLDRREHPLRAQPNVVGQEHGQDDRGDDRAHHRPARLRSRGLAAQGFHPPILGPRYRGESSPLDDVVTRKSAKDRGDDRHLTCTLHSRSRRSTSRGSSSRRRRSTTSSSCR